MCIRDSFYTIDNNIIMYQSKRLFWINYESKYKWIQSNIQQMTKIVANSQNLCTVTHTHTIQNTMALWCAFWAVSPWKSDTVIMRAGAYKGEGALSGATFWPWFLFWYLDSLFIFTVNSLTASALIVALDWPEHQKWIFVWNSFAQKVVETQWWCVCVCVHTWLALVMLCQRCIQS